MIGPIPAAPHRPHGPEAQEFRPPELPGSTEPAPRRMFGPMSTRASDSNLNAPTRWATRRWGAVLHRWPTALGLLAAAAALATGAERELPAIAVSIAACCYLAAAALGRPWVAWVSILGAGLVVVLSELLGLAWWIGLGAVALVLVLIGLRGHASRPALVAQTAAVAGFGGLAVVAMFLAPRVGLVLAAAVLAVHCVWDVIHHRRNRVVPRSLAEFCMFLDVPVGVGLLVLASVG
jgi:hypothetical protein